MAGANPNAVHGLNLSLLDRTVKGLDEKLEKLRRRL